MSAPNPLEKSHSAPPAAVSSKTYHIAGILTTVYGLEELPTPCESIACVWLLHPRLQTKEIMGPVGASCIYDWNGRRKPSSKKGLIAVAFDQRNHGSREVDKIANEAWRSGNPNHSQDMFSIFHGTALDTSLLIDHLGSYILLDPGSPRIEQHFVLGISLGGHAAWQVIFNEPRVTAAVVIIGCPDYMHVRAKILSRERSDPWEIGVMSDRARLSKLETYAVGNGVDFLGSKDFPSALVASALKWDPRGVLFGIAEIKAAPSLEEQSRLRSILDSKIKGKSVLVCSGSADKLVPYHCSAPFMDFLKKAAKGWYSDGNVYVEDNVYEGIEHAYSDGMSIDTRRFLCDLMEGKDSRRSLKESSRI